MYLISMRAAPEKQEILSATVRHHEAEPPLLPRGWSTLTIGPLTIQSISREQVLALRDSLQKIANEWPGPSPEAEC